MIYPSKKDWWVALTVWVVALMDFGIGGILLYFAVVQAAPVLLAGFASVLVALLVLWIYASTHGVLAWMKRANKWAGGKLILKRANP